ncbi:uncharacterized protein J3D65DRAFT_170970 [Phyllosticta citribraziliensis]|uniref:Secreted protein n=1 Tax=Phyllosticta citribraziliensis TaxID=989973 RepID=A0ABR1L2U2_9PEZI
MSAGVFPIYIGVFFFCCLSVCLSVCLYTGSLSWIVPPPSRIASKQHGSGQRARGGLCSMVSVVFFLYRVVSPRPRGETYKSSRESMDAYSTWRAARGILPVYLRAIARV